MMMSPLGVAGIDPSTGAVMPGYTPGMAAGAQMMDPAGGLRNSYNTQNLQHMSPAGKF